MAGALVPIQLLKDPSSAETLQVVGSDVQLGKLLPVLCTLPPDARCSDSLRCFSYLAKLGLELAASCRVAPTSSAGKARWRALLSRPHDRARFERLAAAMPPAGRALVKGKAATSRWPEGHVVAREFIDAVVDGLYRQNGYPGASRGWVHEFAEALRGPNASFTLRDARHQGLPDRIRHWSESAEVAAFHLRFTLGMAEVGGPVRFPLDVTLYAEDAPTREAPINAAWAAGATLHLGNQRHLHPTWNALRQVARALRLFPPLLPLLGDDRPSRIALDAADTWALLSKSAAELREAGFEVVIPEEFRDAGSHRLRARLKLDVNANPEGEVDWNTDQSFEWEVVLGDIALDGATFRGLVARGQPIVEFQGRFVLLDPEELKRLPQGVTSTGSLPALDALRSALIGERDGVGVTAGRNLLSLVQSVLSPPPRPLPKGLQGTLRPYQKDGYDWLGATAKAGLGACLADDMGLGKTIQVIAHLLDRKKKKKGPHLVVVPTSVLGNWTREIDRFAPELSWERHHGSSRNELKKIGADVILTTYGLLVKDEEELAAIDWDCVVLDEAQAIKNPDALRARAARRLKARHRIALSGTPIENRLDELWSVMQFLNPGFLGPRERFHTQVAVPIERFGNEEQAERLRMVVRPFLLRRLKTDPKVITDLPDKIERLLYCGLSREQAKLYQQVVEEGFEKIRESADIERRGQVLAMLGYLKQICNHPSQFLKESGGMGEAERWRHRSGKIDRLTELLDTLVERQERTILFTQYKDMGERLKAYIEDEYGENVPFLYGATPAQARDEMVRAFQEDDDASWLLIVSLKAGGTGLNLTRATHVVHYDRWWNPAVEDQATDRAYRIGQHQNVQVHKLVCQGTLEERIDQMHESKRALADSIVGGAETVVSELDDAALRAFVALGDDAWMEP